MQLDRKKTPITCKKNRLWLDRMERRECCLYAICHHQSRRSPNEFVESSAQKCNMLVKNEPTKDTSTPNTHRYYTHTHTAWIHACVQPKTRRISNIEFFSSFFTSLLVLFCFVFGSAPALWGGRSNMKLKLLSEFMCADRQRIKIIFIIKCEPQIISVSSGIFTWIVVVSVQLIEFLAFISYVNLSDPKVCREDRTAMSVWLKEESRDKSRSIQRTCNTLCH